MTSMTLAKVIRSDSGKYTVELESELGKAKVDIEVVVLGEYASVDENLLFTNGNQKDKPVIKGV